MTSSSFKCKSLIILPLICSCLFFISLPSTSHASDDLPEGIKHLLLAYPDHLTNASKNSILWNDGSQMIYNDGNSSKDYEMLLHSPDLEDQMAMEYPLNFDVHEKLTENFDPGRIRYEPFFKKMYGSSRREVKKHLVPIKWLPGTVNKTLYITSVNDVNKKLQAISDELDKLPPEYKKFLDNPAGTFKWRYIAGTKRLSSHSFGIAIDINVNHSSYWRWDLPAYKYRNQIPRKIVEIFEKYQFIWGGKWYHYDTMHFEYRPELLPGEEN